jgi:hypothetical protein
MLRALLHPFVMRIIGRLIMHKGPSLRTLLQIVDRFNRDFPVGTPVILKKDNGIVETVVESPAEVLGGHSAVGWFRGVRGCYSIEGGRVWGVESA